MLIALTMALLCGVAHARDEAAKESEKLAGTWQTTSAVNEGEKMPDEQASRIVLVFTGEKFEVSNGGKSMMKGTFTIDPSKTPKTIDMKSTSGKHQGKTTPGIYELDGDSLKICMVPPDEQRPKKLNDTAKNGGMFMMCKRKMK